MEKDLDDTNELLKKIYEMENKIEEKLDEIIDITWNIGTLLEGE
jgi:ferritin